MHNSACISVHQAADGLPELDLDGDINVACASQLQCEAVRLADGGQDVRVCGEHIEGLDTSAVQILAALKQALASQGKTLHWHGLSAESLGLLRLAGLSDSLRPAGSPLDGTPADRGASEVGGLQ
jgi:anti-anti-sigma regulatory factor